MAIIADLKNAIRDCVYSHDETINFNFNKMEVTEYPYVFFYIPSYKLDKAINPEYWSKLNLTCVIEFAKSEDNSNIELWSYADDLSEMFQLIDFKSTKLETVTPPEYKIVDDVLQMTFDLEFYAKEIDETELMQELDLTIK